MNDCKSSRSESGDRHYSKPPHGRDDPAAREDRVVRLADLVSRLYAHAPPIDTSGERVRQRDFVEIALLIGEQGEGQYRTKTIKSKLSTEYDGPAPTKLPPEKDNTQSKRRVSPATAFSRNHHSGGQFRSLPTEWKVEDWVEEAAALASEFGLEPANAADLAEESQGLPGNEGQGLKAALAKALKGDREEDGEDEREDEENESDRCGSNGLGPNGNDPHQNRPSDDSDRISEVDTNHVYKGFCFRRRGTREQRLWLDQMVDSMPERMLFLHLLKKGQQVWYTSSESDERCITVPAEDMVELMGASYPTEGVWSASDLIEPYRNGYYVPDKEARQFKIPTEVKVEWTERGQTTRSKRYLLYTPTPERAGQRRPLTDDLQDENDNAYPDVVKESLETLTTQQIDMNAIDEAELRLVEMDSAKSDYQLAQLQEAKDTIERQITDIDEDGIATIQNAHEMQPLSGRVSFKDGGPMALPGPVKAKAYDLPGVKNWDIRSCHTVGLRQLADDLAEVGVDIDTGPLDEYLAEDEQGRSGKYKVAARTGLPSGLVKCGEHGVKYLMALPSSIDHASAITGGDPEQLDIVEEAKLYEEWGEIDDVDEPLAALREVLTDLRAMAEEMAEALLDEYWEAHKKPGGPAGWAMENAAGVLFRPDDWEEGHERKSHVIAWYLQGLESSYVHEITRLSKEEDFEVWTNEHDGLQTKGDIPQRVMDEAADRSGFHRAKLVEKDHADEEEIEALYGPQDGQQEPQGEDQEQDLTAREREQRRLARYNAKREIPNLSEREMRQIRSGYEAPDGEEGPQPLPGAGGRGVACVSTT